MTGWDHRATLEVHVKSCVIMYGRGTVEFSFSTVPLPYLYRTSTSTCIVALQYTPTICSIIKHYEAMLWAKGLEVWRLQFRSCGRYGRYPNLSINQSKILSIYSYPSTCWSHIEWLLLKRVSWLHGFTPNCGAGWKWSFGTSRVLCWGTLHAAVTRLRIVFVAQLLSVYWNLCGL